MYRDFPQLPTEPVGSIPRPAELIQASFALADGLIQQRDFDRLTDIAVEDTLRRFEATGSPVITDGEQAKPTFATYPVHGLWNVKPGGVSIPFEDGHIRRLPLLTAGPFRFKTHAVSYLWKAAQYTSAPLKQAVISPSALSLIYPAEGLPDYPRERFIADLLDETEADIRNCLRTGALVQIDFTEARLSLKIDPTGNLLRSFVGLNNQLLARFSTAERRRIGAHTCPGGDMDSTHSADVHYGELLPSLLALNAGSFFIQLASEMDPHWVLELIAKYLRPGQIIFVGVIDPLNPRIETPDQVCDRILTASRYLPVDQLGTTDDCGFSPFGDDLSTSRDTAFTKIQARIEGTALASRELQRKNFAVSEQFADLVTANESH